MPGIDCHLGGVAGNLLVIWESNGREYSDTRLIIHRNLEGEEI